MSPKHASYLVIGVVLLLSSAANALTIDRTVVDESGVILPEDEEQIDREIRDMRDDSGVQMAVVIIDTLDGEPIEDYAHRHAEAWGGGDAGVDQGVLLVLAMNDRRMRLEVGYGLEGVLTDAIAAQILERAGPAMRNGRVGLAVLYIVQDVDDVTSGAGLSARVGGSVFDQPLFFFAFYLGFALAAVWMFKRKKWFPNSKRKKKKRNIAWLATFGALLGTGGILWLLVSQPFSLVTVGVYASGLGPGVLFGLALRMSWKRSVQVATIVVITTLVLLFYFKAMVDWLPPWTPSHYFAGMFVGAITAVMTGVSLMMVAMFAAMGCLILASIEGKIRKRKLNDTYSMKVMNVVGGIFMPPASGGGGSSYSSSSSGYSSSPSYSSSSSSSSSGGSWSGGGGSFGGGGASSSW